LTGTRWPRAQIQLKQHSASGRLMWATAYRLATSGAGYLVDPMWGRFAATRKAALLKAVDELRGLIARKTCDIAGQILRWLDRLLTGADVAV
jgi:hypothetical protein